MNSTATFSHLGDRHVFQPYGIFGGKPGALAESILNPQGNGEKLQSKETREIKKGDSTLTLRDAQHEYVFTEK